MAAILVFCFHANWPLWPRSRLNNPLNFTFESEAIKADFHGNKRILKWRPFWNKVYMRWMSGQPYWTQHMRRTLYLTKLSGGCVAHTNPLSIEQAE